MPQSMKDKVRIISYKNRQTFWRKKFVLDIKMFFSPPYLVNDEEVSSLWNCRQILTSSCIGHGDTLTRIAIRFDNLDLCNCNAEEDQFHNSDNLIFSIFSRIAFYEYGSSFFFIGLDKTEFKLVSQDQVSQVHGDIWSVDIGEDTNNIDINTNISELSQGQLSQVEEVSWSSDKEQDKSNQQQEEPGMGIQYQYHLKKEQDKKNR